MISTPVGSPNLAVKSKFFFTNLYKNYKNDFLYILKNIFIFWSRETPVKSNWPVARELIIVTHWKCLTVTVTEVRMFWSLISRIVSRRSKLTNRDYFIQNVMAFLVTIPKFVKTWKNTLLCDSMSFFPFIKRSTSRKFTAISTALLNVLFRLCVV